ncbi:MAG: MFS transporter [Nonlabens sp.]
MNFKALSKSIFQILLLVLAGEANFILPFVIPRVFRPTVLEAFQLSNTELGICFSVYGIVAMISYVFGGGIADRFAPRYLMAISLVMTALGGFYFASYPNFEMLCFLYGYWGFTTIFLFWAAMIKATRLWGGNQTQGLAFGLLDGGRGLVAFSFGFIGLAVFSYYLNDTLVESSLANLRSSFELVLQTCTVLIILIAVFVFLFIKTDQSNDAVQRDSFSDILINYRSVVKLPSVYLLMVIVLCAYSGYKITDIYSQFANEIMGYNQEEAAQLGTNLLGIRIVIGVVAGLLADRFNAGIMMVLGFGITLVGAMLFASGYVSGGHVLLFLTSIILTALGVYAIRTLYFAAVHEGKIPIYATGTAVGIISLIGYTPDVFMGPLIGYFLDGYIGLLGFQLVFGSLAVFSLIGLVFSFLFLRLNKPA